MSRPTPLVLAPVADERNVFFDLEIAGEKAGRVVFKLYDDIVPKVRFRAPPPLVTCRTYTDKADRSKLQRSRYW